MEVENLDEHMLCKILLNVERLAILGVAAKKPVGLPELAARTGLHLSKMNKQVNQLIATGLLQAYQDDGETRIKLNVAYILTLARQLGEADAPPKVELPALDALDEKNRNLARGYIKATGALEYIPDKPERCRAVVQYVAHAFEANLRYTEKQVNDILIEYHPDYATLRRCLIDFNFMQRELDGSWDWLAERA